MNLWFLPFSKAQTRQIVSFHQPLFRSQCDEFFLSTKAQKVAIKKTLIILCAFLSTNIQFFLFCQGFRFQLEKILVESKKSCDKLGLLSISAGPLLFCNHFLKTFIVFEILQNGFCAVMSGYLHAKDRNDLKNKEVFKKECDVFINAAIPIGEIVLPDKGCLISECLFYFGPILKQRCTNFSTKKLIWGHIVSHEGVRAT